MAKDTLLTIVQDILSAMDSDEVDSINDTTESLQVARIVRNTYYDIVDRTGLPVDQSLFNLTASGSALQPTVMFIPSNVSKVDWIKYDCMQASETDPDYRDIVWVPTKTFFDMTNQYNADTDTTVDRLDIVIGTNAVAYFFHNDRAPRFFTAYDDNTILFDAYDSAVDLTLQSSKTQCGGKLNETFSVTDSFIPNLNDAQFSLLRNEAKSLAFAELKQTVHAKAEGTSKRLWTALQRNQRQIQGKSNEFDRLPNYGRK